MGDPFHGTVESIFSVALTLFGLSYLLRARAWARLYVELEMHPERYLPTGLLVVAVGLFVATTVDDWSTTWPIFITAFGWLFALEGLVLTVKPAWLGRFASKLGEHLVRYLQLGGLLLSGLGLLLCWEYWVRDFF